TLSALNTPQSVARVLHRSSSLPRSLPVVLLKQVPQFLDLVAFLDALAQVLFPLTDQFCCGHRLAGMFLDLPFRDQALRPGAGLATDRVVGLAGLGEAVGAVFLVAHVCAT